MAFRRRSRIRKHRVLGFKSRRSRRGASMRLTRGGRRF